MENKEKSQIVIYQDKGGQPGINVRFERDTLWLDAHQMAELFGRDRSVIVRHIRNVYDTKELEREPTCAKNAQVAADGKVRVMDLYNLDMIISVGYRVNSRRGTQFRIWATNVLRKHLVDGYTINESRLRAAEGKYAELCKSIRLLENVAGLEGIADETKGLIQVISSYSHALDVLDDHDHERLSTPEGTARVRFVLTYEEAQQIIRAMREKFSGSDLFGREKDSSFKGSLSAIHQTFGGKDLYLTVESKAAHLLYFVTKNHSFVDGNKRIAAALFICFLQRNRILFNRDGSKRIDDNALVALTLLVAASRPADKENVIKVILNLLGHPGKRRKKK